MERELGWFHHNDSKSPSVSSGSIRNATMADGQRRHYGDDLRLDCRHDQRQRMYLDAEPDSNDYPYGNADKYSNEYINADANT